jgi:hypothetical protein
MLDGLFFVVNKERIKTRFDENAGRLMVPLLKNFRLKKFINQIIEAIA